MYFFIAILSKTKSVYRLDFDDVHTNDVMIFINVIKILQFLYFKRSNSSLSITLKHKHYLRIASIQKHCYDI